MPGTVGKYIKDIRKVFAQKEYYSIRNHSLQSGKY